MEGFATHSRFGSLLNGLPISAVECKSPKHQPFGIRSRRFKVLPRNSEKLSFQSNMLGTYASKVEQLTLNNFLFGFKTNKED
jgi:hypothetical protein